MKRTQKFVTVLVTTPDKNTARKLTRAALKAKLIACANIIPQIESHYWWQGKVEHGKEALLLLKTESTRVNALEKLILSLHPYDTPEFIVLNITRGNDRYLAWLSISLQ
jgi:periplasmic divalent cation tolerance protein